MSQGSLGQWWRTRPLLAGFALLALGIGLRCADYDREGWLLAFRYAMQWPVLAAFAGALAGLSCAVGRRWPGVIGLFVAFACAVAWVRSSRLGNEQRDFGSAAVRFAYWNAAGPQERLDGVITHAHSFGADFLAIGEAASEHEPELARWRSAFRGHTVLRLRGEMLIATRGVVQSTRYGSLRGKGGYNLIELTLRGEPLRVLVVDLEADATRSRREAFEALDDVVAASMDQPLIVLGDFNTPTDSPHFRLLRGPLRDAWQTAGRGFSESWPVPVPLLRLDHVWISPRVHPTAFRMDWSLLSDHRAQILEATLH